MKFLANKLIDVRDFYERKQLLERINRIVANVWHPSANNSLSVLSDNIGELTNSLNLTLDFDELRQIVRHENNLKILKSIARFEINVPITEYVSKAFEGTFDCIKVEHNWSKFLENVYDFFVDYEVQKDVRLYNVQNMKDWKIRDRPQGLNVTIDNLPEFAKHFIFNSDIEMKPNHLNELNEIIEFTLKSSPTVECNGDTMVIEGNFLKSSDIQSAKCQSGESVSKIRIFVVSTFFVDSNLYLDKELEILTDKWIVLNEFTFYLNGKDGKMIEAPNSLGTPGRPGNIGTNGKNFFGASNEIINGNLLTVNTNGGNGGMGQDGSGNFDQKVHLPDTSHTGWIRFNDNVQSFYREYLTDWHQYAQSRSGSESLRYFAVLWLGTYKTNFYDVYPLECCGQIGLGGSGNGIE